MGEAVGNQKAEVATMLRSVIQSSKGGVLVTNLQREYKLLVGDGIPFRKMGYQTLEAFLKDMPDIVKITRNSSGEQVVQAVADPATAHIASLVARQKTTKTNNTAKTKRRPLRMTQTWKPQTSQYLPRMNYQRQTSSRASSVPQKNFAVSTSKKQTEEIVSDIQPLLQKVSSSRKPVNIKHRNLPPRLLRAQQIVSPSSVPSSPDELKETSYPPPLLLTNSWTDTIPSSPPPLQLIASNRDIIHSYASAKGLSVTFRNLPLNTKESPLTYISTLMIGNQKFNSYPNDKPTIRDAEEEAARVAVDSLDLRPGQKSQSLPITCVTTIEDIENMLYRILQVIDGKQNGLWNMKVESVYKETYREILPLNWIKLVSQHTSDIQVNEIGENRSILYPVQKNSLVDRENQVKTPEPLILPNTEYLDIFVSYLTSTVDIAVQLLDYSESYENLISEMHTYYKDHKHPIQKAEEGKLYAVNLDNCWNRVRVVNIMGNLVECYFVDHGDSEIVNMKYLHELQSNFAHLPFQAIKCQLNGLEEYAKNKITLHHLTNGDLLLGKTLVAEVINRKEPLSLILYDTSTDEDININQYLIEITEKETITPKLPKVGGITEVYLSHVEENGDIYVQVCGSALDLLANLTNEFSTQCEKFSEVVTSVTTEKMYYVKHMNNWYRAIIKMMPSDESSKMVEVLCVDYGNCATIPIENVYELGQLSDVLTGLPYQALRCQLHDIPPNDKLEWSERATKKLFNLTPENQILLLKVVSEATIMNPTSVEIFKRIEPSDQLVSINQTLALSTDIFSEKGNLCVNDSFIKKDEKNFIKPLMLRSNSIDQTVFKPVSNSEIHSPLEENTVALSKHYSVITPDGIGEQVDDVLNFPALKPPVLPEIGDFFDVHIINTAHPYNFTCQSWKQGAELDLLFHEMQQFYSSEENTFDMDECLLKTGQFYAAKHEGKWYRVLVKDILGDEMVSAYFVDYGGYTIIGLNDLQPLWKYFRILSFQAINAELYGVEPVHGDWNPCHCMQFKKLVDGKEFVSIIKRKMPDKTTTLGSEKLSVVLIDTSDPDKDVYIDRVLANAGIVKLQYNT